MSTFLSIEWDPVEQPAASDPLERRTWCALRIRIAGRTVTRIWDRALHEERAQLYVPAFPIARWIVENWWVLLNEPCRSAEVPGRAAAGAHLPWIKRHCLRSADSALLLPALYLFNDGRGLRAEWHADDPDSLPHMPGEFVDSGSARLDEEGARDTLSRFVSETLRRVAGLDLEEAEALAAGWHAIERADADERKFCVAAGRMGLDPYDPAELDDELAHFIESRIVDPDRPVTRDLIEVAAPRGLAEQWSWVTEASAALDLGPMKRPPPIVAPAAGLSPWDHGYHLAARVRAHAGMPGSAPVASVPEIAERVAREPYRLEDRNHLPGGSIRAVVGWSPNDGVFVAGPLPQRGDNRRFLQARGLYHALFSCGQSERLVTQAHTWDQQASRAFAAELLAPRAELAARAPGGADSTRIEELAREFQASPVVISNQLQNAGVDLRSE